MCPCSKTVLTWQPLALNDSYKLEYCGHTHHNLRNVIITEHVMPLEHAGIKLLEESEFVQARVCN